MVDSAIPTRAISSPSEKNRVTKVQTRKQSREAEYFQTESDNVPTATVRWPTDHRCYWLGLILVVIGLATSHGVGRADVLIDISPEDIIETPSESSGLVSQAQIHATADSGSTTETRDDPQPNAEELPLEEIVVTGTNIVGAKAASPIIVIDREYIESTGFSTVGQLVDSLPQNFSSVGVDVVTSPDRQSGQNRGSGTTVNLRGLGAGSTLVLLNGNRLAPSGETGGFVDISVIPLVAIERVEVLTDGASAIYGADAVGGVANFITKSDFDGANTQLRYGTVTEGDMDEFLFSQTFGANWRGGTAFAAYEYFSRDNLRAEDRNFTDVIDADLSAGADRHSLYAVARHSLSGDADVVGSILYSTRDSDLRTNASRPRFRESTTDQLDVALGVEIDLSTTWNLDLSGNFSNNDLDYEITLNTPTSGVADSRLTAFSAIANGPVFNIPGGATNFAIGSEYRHEAFEFTDTLRNQLEADADRDVYAIFGEFHVPLVTERNALPSVYALDLSLAIRFEDYSDFGSTTNPKIGLRWAPIKDLMIRGTFGTSFKAPNLSDLSEVVNRAALFNSLDAASTLTLALQGNNAALKAEEAATWTAGFDFRPDSIPGFDVSATYFSVDYEDRIDSATTNVFAPLLDPDFFAPIITFDPDTALVAALIADAEARGLFFNFGDNNVGPLIPVVPSDVGAIVDMRLNNLAFSEVRGVEFDVSYEVETETGTFGIGAAGNYLIQYENAITATSGTIDIVDTVFHPADFRVRGDVSWVHNDFSIDAFVNYVDGYTDDREVNDVSVSSFTTVDLQFRYYVASTSSSGLFSGLTVSLTALNIFDEDPPSIVATGFSPLGFDPTNANPLGRFISLQIDKAW